MTLIYCKHNDVIKWKHFPRYWPFVRGIHWSPVNSLHKGQWYWALMFSLICAWINGWVNNRDAGDLRRHRGHYDVRVMNSTARNIPRWNFNSETKYIISWNCFYLFFSKFNLRWASMFDLAPISPMILATNTQIRLRHSPETMKLIFVSQSALHESFHLDKVSKWIVDDIKLLLARNKYVVPPASKDSKVHGANMGLIWGLSAPDEPHVGPMNLAIREDMETVL